MSDTLALVVLLHLITDRRDSFVEIIYALDPSLFDNFGLTCELS